MAVKMAVVKNLVAVKGLQVAVNFGEGGSEGLLRSGNPDVYCRWYNTKLICRIHTDIFRSITPWSQRLMTDLVQKRRRFLLKIVKAGLAVTKE